MGKTRLPEDVANSLLLWGGIQSDFIQRMNLEPLKAIMEAQSKITADILANESLRKDILEFQTSLRAFEFIAKSEVAQTLEQLSKPLKDLVAMSAQWNAQWDKLIRPTIIEFRQFGRFGRNHDPLPVQQEDPPIVISDLREVDDTLLRAVTEDPNLLLRVRSRTFEKLVAEILKRKGYEVQLKQGSRDGGVDVVAIRRDDVGQVLLLVQCKQNAPTNKVGVRPVRELHGVVTSERANAGLIVTTSSFTRDAKKYVETHQLQYQLQLKDFIELKLWVNSLGPGSYLAQSYSLPDLPNGESA